MKDLRSDFFFAAAVHARNDYFEELDSKKPHVGHSVLERPCQGRENEL